MERSVAVTRTGSFRKRPLEARKSDGTEALPPKHSERSHDDQETGMDLSSSPSKQTSLGTYINNGQHFLDEVEEHFQRSLANMRSSQPSTKPLVVLPSDKQKSQTHSPLVVQSPQTPTPQQPSQYKTILPKPLPSDTHDIIVTENSLHSAMSMVTTAVANTNASTNAKQTSTAKVTWVTSSPSSIQSVQKPVGGMTISRSVVINPSQPVSTTPAVSLSQARVIPSMMHGMQLVDVNQQKMPTFLSVTSPQSISIPNQSSVPGLVSVAQVPTLINMSSAANKSPMVAVSAATLGNRGMQRSPAKKQETTRLVASTTLQPTLFAPQPSPAPPTLASVSQQQQQLMTVIDPSSFGSHGPILLLSGNTALPLTMPHHQPYILVNPTDITGTAPMGTATYSTSLMGTALPNLINTTGGVSSVIPNPSVPGSYILLAPGMTGTTPLVGVVSDPQATAMVTSPIVTSPATGITSAAPQTSATVHVSSVGPARPSANPLAQTSLEGHAADLIAPASVEDHFAKALGDQWSQLKNNLQPQAVGVQQNTVAS